eukprot:COSAG05_NODE_2101_length_3558_cov_944.617520_4_plen_59_part_00
MRPGPAAIVVAWELAFEKKTIAYFVSNLTIIFKYIYFNNPSHNRQPQSTKMCVTTPTN